MADRNGWRRDSSCVGYRPVHGEPWPWDTDRLRGRLAGEVMADRTEKARHICGGCPVRDRCLTEGLINDIATGMPDGIWGGQTPEERAALIGRRIKWISGMRRLAGRGAVA